ncbi:MAG: glutaredoxin family protein [Candidatus Thiodiazotropha taylori]|nr:glutaredoxin family protein [Candidatus Thiodiazotropha taylori]MCG7961421.1 glutaredoxin family protein [Candidatus Thiodiazotropha endolucinida]MCG8088452.1 glutaredoxin family protein [Candidatus Thiodiazotropha taylori]MCW4227459.1 glutaredoxin family protein [Candidatus Thiodiazotropha taylori]MCW4245169.1 glutaredoxin family protein [Candidatus Thiodiazotropha taylori]
MNIKSAKINWILLPILLLSAAVAEAEIFKWTDEHGKVHFTDKPPADADASEVKLKINTIKSVSFDRSIFNFGRKVVIYSTEWCGYCEKAKRYFKRKKIKYTEYDIEKSSRAKRQYKKMGATGVPVILVGKRRMNGFSEAGFEKIYNKP